MMLALWRAETRKLLSRTLGRVGLLLAGLIGLAGPLLLHLATSSGAEFNGTPTSEMFDMSGADALLWALWMRNGLVMRLMLVALAGLVFAGELNARTLRDDLVRPVARHSILLAKWAALATWLVIGAALTWLTGMTLGCILFGTGGPWADASLAYLTTILCDIGFTTIALAFSVVLRSTIGTLLGMMAFIAADALLWGVLKLIETFGQATESTWAIEVAVQSIPFLPSSAFGLWTGWMRAGDPAIWQNFVALFGLTVLGLFIAIARFQRMDVP